MATSVDIYLAKKSRRQPELADMPAHLPPVRAKYDAAQDTTEFKNYWARTDALSSDAANSKGVRQKLIHRSRYEVDNNAYVDGMAQTHANYLVGLGPKLRMRTQSNGFNQLVERQWARWSKTIHLRRKLWAMSHAKMVDGEAFAMLGTNPRVMHEVKLDVKLFEAEQCTSPYLPWGVVGYIDGVRFDEFGNPLWYDVLRYHPGGEFYRYYSEPDQIPARFILHWYAMRRPGQHRGVPEMKSSLNCGASSRRWREATLAAAETAADISVLLKTQMSPDEGAVEAAPFSSIEFQKRMMTALPMGWDAGQMKAEHPNATYEAFHRAQVSEQARPKVMPHNLASGDSSDHNFASGKLDFQPYYMQLDVEREDANDTVLDPLFREWFNEAAMRFGWVQIEGQYPEHSWDWPSHPVADTLALAETNEKRLRTGQASPRRVYSEQGLDFEDHVQEMAEDFGVDVATMRRNLMVTLMNDRSALASMAQAEASNGQQAEA